MSKQNAKNKGRKEPKLAKNVAKSSLEIGEELNIEPRLRPAKTGSVSQNTSKPIKPRKIIKIRYAHVANDFVRCLSHCVGEAFQNLFTLKTNLLILLTLRSYTQFLKYYNIIKRKK